MIRAVVDTNILIRAVIKPEGIVGPVITCLRHEEYLLVYSLLLIDELLEKLSLPRIREKYHVTDQDIDDLLALVALRGELVIPTRKIIICRDPKDDMVIETAVAGRAGVVVTGDEDLLTLKQFESVQFIPSHTFLSQVKQSR